ncbi:MAG: protein-L-isoaspartate(D-aspartate) O-methyltransferase [Candidatus Sumerlaeia bacterium]
MSNYTSQRKDMVKKQIAARGVRDSRVLKAMKMVERHRFVPEDLQASAYEDRPLPIGHDQTISQPYIVALMTEMLQLGPGARVLEIGTGCGYQTAVLCELAAEVFSIEIVESLSEKAGKALAELGYDNFHLRVGDAFQGWPEEAPFDGIIGTAAPARIPQPLLDQLAPGGRLVMPVGAAYEQKLKVVEKTSDGFRESDGIAVRFVPMTGRAME